MLILFSINLVKFRLLWLRISKNALTHFRMDGGKGKRFFSWIATERAIKEVTSNRWRALPLPPSPGEGAGDGDGEQAQLRVEDEERSCSAVRASRLAVRIQGGAPRPPLLARSGSGREAAVDATRSIPRCRVHRSPLVGGLEPPDSWAPDLYVGLAPQLEGLRIRGV